MRSSVVKVACIYTKCVRNPCRKNRIFCNVISQYFRRVHKNRPYASSVTNSWLSSVEPTPWGTGGMCPTFINGWARGYREQKNSKQETDQTVLTITKALTKTTTCAFRAKKWRDTTKKNISGALRRIGAPNFALNRCPHFQILSGPLAADEPPMRFHDPRYRIQPTYPKSSRLHGCKLQWPGVEGHTGDSEKGMCKTPTEQSGKGRLVT